MAEKKKVDEKKKPAEIALSGRVVTVKDGERVVHQPGDTVAVADDGPVTPEMLEADPHLDDAHPDHEEPRRKLAERRAKVRQESVTASARAARVADAAGKPPGKK